MFFKLLSHSRAASWLMILGFAFSLTSVLEGIGMLGSILYDSRAAAEYAFTSQLQITLTGSPGTVWDIETLLEGTQALAAAEGVEMYLDTVPEASVHSWTVLLGDSRESLKQPLKWGRLPQTDGYETGSYEAAIPDTFEQYAEERNGDLFLKVQGNEYRVTGVFDTSQSSDAGIFLMGYRSLPEAVFQKLIGGESFTFMLKSDFVNVYDQLEIISRNADAAGAPVLISAREPDMETPILLTMENTGLSLAFSIYLFSVANCLVVANYWILTKRKDMAVRKAFGWSNKNLMAYITKEMGVILAVSLLFCALALTALAALSPEQFAFTVTPLFLLSTAGLLLFTLCIAVSVPFYRILKIRPAEVIE